MNLTIREAAPNDYEQIFLLIKEFAAFIKTPEKVLISPDQMLQDREYFRCFVVTDNEKIIAFSTYFFAYYSWTGKAIYLDDLYVTETYRGKGIGNLLFNKIIETAKNNNCKKVKWQVSNWNKKAIKFYKNKGALIDDVEINCDLFL